MNGLRRCHKKDKLTPFAAMWMDLETFILTEVSQKQKDKYHMISLICGIYNMEQMILSKNNKQTNKHAKKETDHGQEEQAWSSRRQEEGERGGWMGILGAWGMQTVILGMDGQWDPTAQHREMCVIGQLCCTTELDETL